MIWFPLLLGLVGLLLSAFFSGTETGFYRATRMRLVLDALGGDWIARWLLWLTNRPSMFIATTLVGNNLANWLVALAIVMVAQSLAPGHLAFELLAPLVLAPFLFVYGESLPKNLFLHAPNRLLRKSAPLFLVFVPLFFPISGLLWLLDRLLAGLLGKSPEKVRLTLARRELRRVLDEGHEAGILHPSQRQLARGIFAVANQSVIHYTTPPGDLPRARAGMSKQQIKQLARRYRIAQVPIETDGDERPTLLGYVRMIDLELNTTDEVAPVRPLMKLSHHDTHIKALTRMHGEHEELAEVVDDQGRSLGIVTAARLQQRLFLGEGEGAVP